jgi:hypothetical protein
MAAIITAMPCGLAENGFGLMIPKLPTADLHQRPTHTWCSTISSDTKKESSHFFCSFA